MRLFVLFAAVAYCYACRLEQFPEDTTNNPQGCSDSDGNLHEFNSEWENGPEACVCVDFGIICCERTWETFGTPVPPEPTTVIGDYFEDLYGDNYPGADNTEGSGGGAQE
ncbi:beta-microseminoprotein-like [Danio aesculapii]|uniref:beta-microseminoprotein-like n=1 Tax=Danio aesculapii TaxID=1142201 RepID=UPI0024C0DCFC|nr:beta-microseminoprotein-like [Danio aesculapii]